MELHFSKLDDHSSFIHKYINDDREIRPFFDYRLNKADRAERYQELMTLSFPREELAHALMKFNTKLNGSGSVLRQIERLKRDESVVVVGGQQAGLLSGPLYTITKMITILVEAAKLEEELSVPVIPIFWIAGEDHDIDEVNRTFFHEGKEIRRVSLPERNAIKQSVSERVINLEIARQEITDAFSFLRETPFTKPLYEELMDDLSHDLTYTEWFAKIAQRFFSQTDLVFLDAADPEIRRIERSSFTKMVTHNAAISQGFNEQADLFKAMGFGEPISTDKDNAHLFFHEGGQRFLLERTEEGFREKGGSRTWTYDSLLLEVEEGTLQLSNNVVTRPVMQELLLPVHTFIGGPGEVKYWGVLKNVFRCFDRKMPLVFPRYHFTFLSRRSQKNLKKYDLSVDNVLTQGVADTLKTIIESNERVNKDKAMKKAKKQLQQWMNELTESLGSVDYDIKTINQQFETKLFQQLSTYERKLEELELARNATHIKRLNELEAEIRPHGIWQERHLNIYPFLNTFGSDLVRRLLNKLIKQKKNLNEGTHISVDL
ncbi:bacillithiol biosynthesis cysteine-adding enzyme BshC [Salipaludibacillus sp. LMS25]|jgi:bacillithiol biosynthesis cysteine-adding enzyme BshC|uniref:bacillithiol biosynthesis cysteine-adding enzyme BshC n=1 Tax=Salipaludibacillus sp. LMS25 TaxID=2924031 RepID=UPI0020D18C8B|nr:bacillithiol biosynthesis cysteine-adding enzyme BshC [Salipaludibacillus sp. LMS25]UTR15197.1 bacillithiol biosynthesis cysteine-adding enzyme BshC [Salipaludibacillus sp. LMS25]